MLSHSGKKQGWITWHQMQNHCSFMKLQRVKMVFTSTDFYTWIFAKSKIVNPGSLCSQRREIRVVPLSLKCLLISRDHSSGTILVVPHITLVKTSFEYKTPASPESKISFQWNIILITISYYCVKKNSIFSC